MAASGAISGFNYRRHVPRAQSFDESAADYDRFASLEPSTVVEWLRTQLPPHGQRALDAGCGAGRHTLALADRFDQVIGVDLSRRLIELARQRRCRPNVQYCVEDLTAFHDPGGFDLVFSATTLHHLPDLGASRFHLRGLVRAGGQVVLNDNVARRPTPLRWVHILGAVRQFPSDVARLGSRQAGWMLKFRTSAPWLEHLAIDRYLSREQFERSYGAIFRGARFTDLGFAHGLVWDEADG